MTDELKILKAAFAQEGPIVARKGAKRTAIAQAMSAYDENLARASQGTGIADRLKDTARAVFETVIGRRPMKHSSALAGGASLGVLALAVLSATYIQTGLRDTRTGVQPAPAPVTPTTKAPTLTPTPFKDALRQQLGQEKTKIAKAEHDRQPIVREAESTTTKVARAKKDSDARMRVGTLEIGKDGRLAGQQRVASQPAPPAVAMRQIAPGALHLDQSAALRDPSHRGTYQDQGRDRFESVDANPVNVVSQQPVSTFSTDVDTASYAFIRASLNNNVLPQKDAVRIEEMINYFPYSYGPPADRAAPFKAHVSVMPAPWAAERKLVHIGIAGFEFKPEQKPASNLVFLLDTSGSMNAPNKLPLVIISMKLLLESLDPEDTVAIVTYAGNAGTALEPTKVKDKAKIVRALDSLSSRGSTAGAEGIRQAYALARQSFDKKGVNRVILATDGDFNVGITNRDELKSFIERQRESGITLSVLGFGRGNYNDALMQTLAQNGNGNAAYIDTLGEARKVLVEEAGSTLFTIAKDVKMQIEFNPRAVAEYRLIGYETRMLKREDFNNDKVDAGDIGAGHTVTAIYEITPTGNASKLVDGLRYETVKPLPAAGGKSEEYAFLKIRYKLPGQDKSKLITTPIGRNIEHGSVAAASTDARFATAVAAFGQILKGGRYTGAYNYNDVIAMAQGAKGADEFGYRAEFINLVRLAKTASSLEPLPPR